MIDNNVRMSATRIATAVCRMLCVCLVLDGCDRAPVDSIVEPCGLPKRLVEVVAKAYPGAQPILLSDLAPDHQDMFRRDHGTRCPGAVAVDFYGSGTPTWALALLEQFGTTRRVTVVVAARSENSWDVAKIDDTDIGAAPVVWSEPAGQYEGRTPEGPLTVMAEHPVVSYVGYESFAVIYAWTGSHVAKIWISD